MRLFWGTLILILATPVLADETRTLKPGDRLARPWLKVAVDPARGHRIAGRAEPVDLTEAKPGKPFTTLLDDGTKRTLLLVEGDRVAYEPHLMIVVLDVLETRIGRTKVWFFDHDADGTFTTPHRDFFVPATRKGIPHPVAPIVIVNRKPYRPADDGWEEAKGYVDARVFPGWTGVADGLDYLNDVRGRMNLPPVAIDKELSRTVLLHLKYLERNGGNGHLEERDATGYTREGAAAGANSIGWIGGGSIATAIDGHLGSLLHRMDLIDPRITRMGFATSGSRVWIHMPTDGWRPWNHQGPVIFPGPDRSWPTGNYTGDNPDPRPEPKGAGLPITVAWFGDESLLKVKAELKLPGRQIPYWKNDSFGYDLKTNHGNLRATILPQGTLRSGRLLLSWEQDRRPCSLTYDFKIGNR